jgi:limonene-1,2-epoxide hydrolase
MSNKYDNSYISDIFSRRQLLQTAGVVSLSSALASLGIQEAMAGGHNAKRVQLTEAQQLALEKANDKLVANFVADYATRDADVIGNYVSDDIAYQITTGMPDIVGRQAFHKHNANMFKGLDKVEWVNLRQFTIGPVVINDRIDEFYPYPGSKTPRMRFRVAGYFLIEDNKIKTWRDFPYPGAKQLIEPAPRA